jgi:hypothetical protein
MVGREGRAHALLLQGGAVCSENELLGGAREVRKTGDGEVLVVEVRVIAQDLVGLRDATVSIRRAQLAQLSNIRC